MDSCFRDQDHPKLLYITPEKVNQSQMFINFLKNLNNQGKIDRFIIDEAHCVSSWGRDFRPDYMHLSILRENFPQQPIMALTATATERVKQDIVNLLKI